METSASFGEFPTSPSTVSFQSLHPMVMRSKVGTVKPNPKYALIVSSIPTEPRTIKAALQHPGWRCAMVEEMCALAQNHTWCLVPRTPDMIVVGCKWVFKSKLRSDGSLERLKARLVIKASHNKKVLTFLRLLARSVSDSSLFIYCHHGSLIFLLLRIDDIVLMSNDPLLLDRFIIALGLHFVMKDLGPLHYFLGVEVTSTPYGLFLSQSKYADDILQCAHMEAVKPLPTPMVMRSSSIIDLTPFTNVTLYRSVVGALQYLTLTRPDLFYDVNIVCQYMYAPTVAHFGMVKRILHYIRGTLDHGLRIVRDSSLDLYAFSYADWVGCSITRHSKIGFCTFLSPNCISWSAKKHPTVAYSRHGFPFCFVILEFPNHDQLPYFVIT
ncbi:uncharacterized mitochondrial protein AtMg00810-like [Macadamia integrifolia]|uniref:uncharacterized mitochondrial protein AtMg00810-like n=1 Tax=Macadamia integrifolia TaxID=60698 RepID=UPI001C4FD28A|nr:uncharacterized mitochondrial protein AtMg00810-like [Macadamia integrifolia]